MSKKAKNHNTIDTELYNSQEQNDIHANCKLCKELYKECNFLPDMSCKEEDIIYDPSLGVHVRKEKKQFKCMYDNANLDWNRVCPREINLLNRSN